jgi:uncharacterized membrane protein (DUF485 family)
MQGGFFMSDIASSARDRRAARREPATPVDWQKIASDSDFRELIRKKRNFIVPATLFFLIYYFGFLVFVGYFPKAAETNVIGNINIAYLLALSEFVMAWVLVFLYVRRAGLFDRLANTILNKVKGASS